MLTFLTISNTFNDYLPFPHFRDYLDWITFSHIYTFCIQIVFCHLQQGLGRASALQRNVADDHRSITCYVTSIYGMTFVF